MHRAEENIEQLDTGKCGAEALFKQAHSAPRQAL
jgi:hypothetical protein